MAHGDLITFRQAVHDQPAKTPRSLGWYRRTVLNGLMGADAVIAPSAWMLDRISACYGAPRRGEVIYPGRNPIFFNPYVSKDDCVLSVGRLVDASKQVFLLTQQPHPLPVCIVGAEQTVPMPRVPIRADVKVATDQTSVAIRGPQTDAQLARALQPRGDLRCYSTLRTARDARPRSRVLAVRDRRQRHSQPFAKSGATPHCISAPTTRPALRKISACSMKIARCDAPTPSLPTRAPASALPPSG